MEPDDLFHVTLSNADGATISDAQGVGTITNDDVSFSINDVSLAEGNSRPKTFAFTVSLTPAHTSQVTVHYSTSNGTATAGSDYTAVGDTTLTFAAGETSKTVNVTVSGDTTIERR